MGTQGLSKAFQCKICEFTTHYNYFGRKPSFCKEIVLLEDAYIMKDPFTKEGGFMVIGGHCSLCHATVCCSQKCSLFYSKRFCIPCSMKHLMDFPTEIQQDLIKTNRSGENNART